MKIAVWGAKGRVGLAIVKIAKLRMHQVFEVDKNNYATFDTPCDVVIDFSLPTATQHVASYCKKHNTPLVVGTTGHSEYQLAILDELKQHVEVVAKANFSKGMDIVAQISKQIALHTGWDVAIVEKHRKGKMDTPSGTAKMLANLLDCKDVCSLRVGNEFGTHTVVFGGVDEQIEISHRATSVDVFALGAVESAEKLINNIAKNVP